LWFDLHQERQKIVCDNEKFPEKVLVVRKKVVPLHPLSGNNLPEGNEKESSLKDLHRQK
jgi:hypothetical protein